MSCPVIGNSVTELHSTKPELSFSHGEIEKRIASTDATQIEILAKKLISRVMKQFDIDIATGTIREESNDQLGYTYPIIHVVSKFDPESKLIRALLPIVTQQITEAFSTPHSFMDEGITFILFDRNNNGILSKISDESCKSKFIKAKQKLIDTFDVNDSMEMTLSVNFTKSIHDLFFDLVIWIDTTPRSYDEGTMDEFEMHVEHCLI